MKNVGASAGFVAIVAVATHFAMPTSPSGRQSGAGTPAVTAQPEVSSEADNPSDEAASPTEGPWLASRHLFQSHVAAGAKLNTADPAQVKSYFGLKPGYQVDFLLATVPDPLRTRLGLSTDASLQAIQKAAEATRWDFATDWLPWEDTVDPGEKNPGTRRAQRALVRQEQRQPGLMTFRQTDETGGSQRVLMVFLVGETPTAGVNPWQFELARAYMRGLGEHGETRLLAPTFSGSFGSLAALLRDDRGKAPALPYVVRSGTATSYGAAEQFAKEFDFRSATASTAEQDGFLGRILSDYRIDPAHAAILVEDESGYGRAVKQAVKQGHPSQIRVFRFPRDISHLRNAYREVSSDSGGSGQAATPDLQFSLKDAGTGKDTITMFSPAQTPVSQNGVLDQIAGAIRDEGIELAEINATNVLDVLFLTRFLRRACPDTRVITPYADLLFAEAARNDQLSGVLAISSYPIFPHSPSVDGTMVPIHAGSNAEGTMNAAALLLTRNPEDQWLRIHALNDYGWQQVGHPPQWLLALDRQGYSPVRVWIPDPARSKQGRKTDGGAAWFENDSPAGNLDIPFSPSPLWTGLTATITFFSLGLAVWIGALWSNNALRLDARFDVPCGADWKGRDVWRLFYVLVLLVTVIGVQAVVCMPALRARSARVELWISFALLGSASLAVVVFRILVFLKRHGRLPVLWTALAFLAVSGGALLLWYHSCFSRPYRSFFFCSRAVDLRFGISPLWPILSAGGALLVFAWVQVTRLFLAAYQQPEVITRDVHPLLQKRLEHAHDEFNRSLLSAIGFADGRRKMYAAIALGLALALIACFSAYRHFSAIDTLSYDLLAMPLQFTVAAALAFTCWEIVVLWGMLRQFLAALETLPLAWAFLPPSRTGAGRPIWVRHLNLQSLDIHMRKLTVLHDLVLLPYAVETPEERNQWQVDFNQRVSDLATPTVDVPGGSAIRKTRQQILMEYRALRETSKKIAGGMLAGSIDRQWRRNAQVWELKAQDETKPIGFSGNPRSAADLCETFVAFHFSSFVIYGVRQIQNLMLFLSLGFVLLTLSLNSYNIQSPQFAGRLLLVLFVVSGAVLWKCLTGIERDAILSRIAGSEAGKLNSEFYVKLAGYGALPVVGLLASEFPSISRFLMSWVAPTLEALK